MKHGFVIAALVCGAMMIGGNAEAASRRARAPKCNVIGLVPLKVYVTSSQRQCFKKPNRAQAAGFAPFTARSLRRATARSTEPCQVVAVPSLSEFFNTRQRKCFATAAKAKRAGYSAYVPGVTSTPPPVVDPVKTPTPPSQPPVAGDPISYSWNLYPDDSASGLTGHCDGVLSGARDRFTMTCTQNATGVTSAHFHLLNDYLICEVMNPGSTFTMDCPLAAGVAGRIQHDRDGLVALHTGPNTLALQGLITPPL